MIDKSFNLTMDKVFKEHYGKNKVIFDNYQKIYGLSNIECKCEDLKNFLIMQNVKIYFYYYYYIIVREKYI